MTSPRKVGLVLGSGSARGWAHIGVLEALKERGIPIHCIAGASIGAFVGAIYATGDLKSLEEFALRLNKRMILSYFDLVFPRSGLLDGKKVHRLFSMHSQVQTFDDFRIPVKMVATDLYTGEQVVLDSGNVVEAVRASLAIPGVLTPVRRDGKILVDGGLVNPVPVDIARGMGADVVVAVNLNTELVSRHRKKPKQPKWLDESLFRSRHHESELISRLADHLANTEASVKQKIKRWLSDEDSLPNILDVIGMSIGIVEERIARIQMAIHPPDVLIEPRLGDLGFLDFDQAERCIREGYVRAMEVAGKIEAKLRAS